MLLFVFIQSWPYDLKPRPLYTVLSVRSFLMQICLATTTHNFCVGDFCENFCDSSKFQHVCLI